MLWGNQAISNSDYLINLDALPPESVNTLSHKWLELKLKY